MFLSQDLEYHSDDNPSKTNKMMRILMFVRILSLIRLARVSRLVRFFNEVEKVSSNVGRPPELTCETPSPFLLPDTARLLTARIIRETGALAD